MARLTNHLIGTGHRQLQFVGNLRFSRSFRDRFIGFRSAMEEHGLEVHNDGHAMHNLVELETDDFTGEIRSWLLQMKKKATIPTVLVCANDLIAQTAMRALIEVGLDVPNDVSVTGFDNLEGNIGELPALTTVHVPKEAMGRRAVEKLLERLIKENTPLEKIMLSGDVVFRDSTVGIKMK